jgi:hypothetical protein
VSTRPHSFQQSAAALAGPAATVAASPSPIEATDTRLGVPSHAIPASRAAFPREPFTAPGDPIQLAIAKAIRELLALQAPRVRGSMDAADFRGRIDLLKRFAAIVDPVLFEIGSQGAENSHDISRGDWEGIVAEALHDRSLLAQFESAADTWLEDNGAYGVGA